MLGILACMTHHQRGKKLCNRIKYDVTIERHYILIELPGCVDLIFKLLSNFLTELDNASYSGNNKHNY